MTVSKKQTVSFSQYQKQAINERLLRRQLNNEKINNQSCLSQKRRLQQIQIMGKYQMEEINTSDLDPLPQSERPQHLDPEPIINDVSANSQNPQLKKEQSKLSFRGSKKLLAITIIICIILVATNITVFIWSQSRNDQLPQPSQKKPLVQTNQQVPLPRILWVYSAARFEGLGMVEGMVSQHQIQIGKKSGFQVRVVDDYSAYDWLSPAITERIRKAKHSTQFFININELLRIALLIQHGGVLIKAGKLILVDNLEWIQQTLHYNYTKLSALNQRSVLQACKMRNFAQILLFYKGNGGLKYYEDGVIVAKKQSRLLVQIFDEMIQVLLRGRRPYDSLQSFGYPNNDGAISMENFFVNLLNFKARYWLTGKQLCSDYGLISINKRQGSYMQQNSRWKRIQNNLQGDRNIFYHEYTRPHVIQYDLRAIGQAFQKIVSAENYKESHKNSIFAQIVQSQGNKWLMNPIPKKRTVQFCIISLKPLPKDKYLQQVKKSVTSLSMQKFNKWKAIYFVKGLSSPMVNHSTKPSVVLVNASEWQGLNLQRAATKYCDQRDIGVILDFDQYFEKNEGLSILADKFTSINVYGAFVSTKVGQKIANPNPNMRFQRKSMQINHNNFKQLNQHFRVFSLHGYRLVPPFDLHDLDGRYFNRQLPFYTLVQYSAESCSNPSLQYYLKNIETRIQIPRSRVYLNKVIIKMATEKKFHFLTAEYKSKANVNTWCYGAYYHLQRLKKNLSDFFILNNGQEFTGANNRKKLPQIIPRKIHQIWVGNRPMAPYKKILMDNIKHLHPSYNYTLWGNANITIQNFPQTYDIIQMLLKFSKVSSKNKMAMVADLMRLEIIYRHGGFYMDTNYYIFPNHTLDHWLTFKAVMPGQQIPIYKYARDNGFFGAVQGFKNIARLLDHRSLSQRVFFNWQANMVTGPFYFSMAMQGEEDFDPQILTLPHEYLYPCYMDRNYCVVPYNTPDKELLFRKTYAYSNNCSKIYYWAFGIDFMSEGASWMK